MREINLVPYDVLLLENLYRRIRWWMVALAGVCVLMCLLLVIQNTIIATIDHEVRQLEKRNVILKARYEEIADKIQPTFGMTSNIALLTLTVLGLVLNFESMIDLVGTFGILAGIIFILVSLVIGYFLGGSKSSSRSVMGLGTAQRNISAAL